VDASTDPDQIFVDEDDRAASSDETKVVDDTPAASRRLSDGRSFDIVKLYRSPDDLERHLRDLGWDIHVRPVGATFLYGSGRPSRRPPSDVTRGADAHELQPAVDVWL